MTDLMLGPGASELVASDAAIRNPGDVILN